MSITNGISPLALDALEVELKKAREVMSQIESEIFGNGSFGSYDDPGSALEYFLTKSFRVMLVCLESFGMNETRELLIDNWQKLSGGQGIRHYTPEPMFCDS
jgi:hypothetical protein